MRERGIRRGGRGIGAFFIFFIARLRFCERRISFIRTVRISEGFW